MMSENRAAPRHRVLKAGTIEFGGGAIDCTVRNVSNIGAALDVASPMGIPEKFTLVLPGDGLHLPCMSFGAKSDGSAWHSIRERRHASVQRDSHRLDHPVLCGSVPI
jgi:hypothetical protein